MYIAIGIKTSKIYARSGSEQGIRRELIRIFPTRSTGGRVNGIRNDKNRNPHLKKSPGEPMKIYKVACL